MNTFDRIATVFARLDALSPIIFMHGLNKEQLLKLLEFRQMHTCISLKQQSIYAHEFAHYYQRMSTTHGFLISSLFMAFAESLVSLLHINTNTIKASSRTGKIVIPIDEAIEKEMYDLSKFPAMLPLELRNYQYFLMCFLHSLGFLDKETEEALCANSGENCQTPKFYLQGEEFSLDASTIRENYAMAFQSQFIREESEKGLYDNQEIAEAEEVVNGVPRRYWCIFDYMKELGLDPYGNFLAPIIFDFALFVPVNIESNNLTTQLPLNHPGIRLRKILDFLIDYPISRLPNPYTEYGKFTSIIAKSQGWQTPKETATLYSNFLKNNYGESSQYLHVILMNKFINLRKQNVAPFAFPVIGLDKIIHRLPPPIISNEKGYWAFAFADELYTKKRIAQLILDIKRQYYVYNFFLRRSNDLLRCPKVSKIITEPCDDFITGKCPGKLSLEQIKEKHCALEKEINFMFEIPINDLQNLHD